MTDVIAPHAKIRLVLVDDHQLVRQGVRALLEAHADMEVVGEAASGEEGVRRAVFEQPDMVLLDYDLPDGSGAEVCKRIRRSVPETSVLILTAYADPDALAACKAAGASGFLLKRVGDGELARQIRVVASGGSAFPGHPDANRIDSDPILSRLTARESKILELIAEGKTNREIADSLYLAEKTVKNYVSNLLMKMEIKHRAGAAAYLARVQVGSELHYPPSHWRTDN